jgi:hypothetical protein
MRVDRGGQLLLKRRLLRLQQLMFMLLNIFKFPVFLGPGDAMFTRFHFPTTSWRLMVITRAHSHRMRKGFLVGQRTLWEFR